ncbi:unnamed protein product [Fusarium graminearum]|uniref:Chromosome 2, complete genome n=1 Tax=Gibberella zeae (strain ATCC MYA-4620 / CBS 123657 / FGSC 9075 / NRRL 31084 / PH-1) TaxID=229533 RepID=A0A098DE65_GIBZE|nr:unnamed protein product [Fusarium graminearum]
MPASPFQTEAWIEYGLGTLILLLRYFARWKTVGFKGYQGDDYFALASLIFWTHLIAGRMKKQKQKATATEKKYLSY